MNEHPEGTYEVFEVARSLLPAAKAFARKVGLDPDTADDSMMEAAKRVLELQQIESVEDSPTKIRNLPAYLFTVYKNLTIVELRRQEREPTISNDDLTTRAGDTGADAVRSVESRILVSEIVKRMNPKSRTIFSYLVLGYAYEEIAYRFKKDLGISVTAATLRSEFSKAVSRITRELDG
jgi:RNA polymerase sigma factor (sigma-70 family)